VSAQALLSAREITHQFGGFTALREVSFEIEPRKLTAIIGPNGAGKSTLFNVLCGALTPNHGRVLFDGQDITGVAQHRYARMGIAKSFQITSVFSALSVLENVRVAVQALRSRYNLWTPRSRLTECAERARELLALVGLQDREMQPANALAHGQQRALEIAIALASNPRLLLLDEPTAGMSPEETREMMHLIVTLAAGRTIVLVEHKMKLVMGISDRILVLHHGELLAQGTPAEIRNDAEVRRVYLGSS
jgi:branched-chain amino acid transport system ATP-binding protein